MRVLLDENLSYLLRHSMAGHDVVTVRYMGWGGLKNGALIAAAEDDGIEVFVTGDRNLSYQQNLTGRRIAIVTLSAQNWPIIRNYLQAIAQAVDRATPGSFQLWNAESFVSVPVDGYDLTWAKAGSVQIAPKPPSLLL